MEKQNITRSYPKNICWKLKALFFALTRNKSAGILSIFRVFVTKFRAKNRALQPIRIFGMAFKRFARCFHNHYLLFISAILLIATIYFMAGIMRFKKTINSSAPEFFNTNDIVNIVNVVDGDQLLIANSDGVKTNLRILGIKSFDPTVSDPLLSEYGKICFNYLKGLSMNQEAMIEVSDKRIDNKGRLLATIYLKDDQGLYTNDIAADLLRKGYTLVYTRYDFKDMQEYLSVQQAAKREDVGFWSNPKIASRADSLLKMWSQERIND